MEETGRVKIDLGECNLKVTRPDGECSEILVSNPDILFDCWRCCWDKTEKKKDFLHCFYTVMYMYW